ncbi:uncharacterized protein LOC141617385 isoform X1 [Silene latifolia]|uniref:uncharacterized protein LOC141617385 isoform X1 n=1 Tax=Silene latifolia TaxID=37657 RepID=UPI003D7761CE
MTYEERGTWSFDAQSGTSSNLASKYSKGKGKGIYVLSFSLPMKRVQIRKEGSPYAQGRETGRDRGRGNGFIPLQYEEREDEIRTRGIPEEGAWFQRPWEGSVWPTTLWMMTNKLLAATMKSRGEASCVWNQLIKDGVVQGGTRYHRAILKVKSCKLLLAL